MNGTINWGKHYANYHNLMEQTLAARKAANFARDAANRAKDKTITPIFKMIELIENETSLRLGDIASKLEAIAEEMRKKADIALAEADNTVPTE